MTVTRSPSGPRHGGNRGRLGQRVLVLLIMTALLMAVAPPPSSRAEEGDAIPVGDFRLLQPVEPMLSASSWVMATGQDPRLLDIPTEGSARGVDWGSYGVVPGGSRSGSAMAPQVPFRSAAPAFSRNQTRDTPTRLVPNQHRAEHRGRSARSGASRSRRHRLQLPGLVDVCLIRRRRNLGRSEPAAVFPRGLRRRRRSRGGLRSGRQRLHGLDFPRFRRLPAWKPSVLNRDLQHRHFQVRRWWPDLGRPGLHRSLDRRDDLASR